MIGLFLCRRGNLRLFPSESSLGETRTTVDFVVILRRLWSGNLLRAIRALEAFNMIGFQLKLNGFCWVHGFGAGSARHTTTSEFGFDGLGARGRRRWF